MRSRHKIAAAVIGSFVLGVGAASFLHAQTKALGYVIAEIDVKDQDGYTKDFLPKAQANIKEFGGKYIGGGLNKAIGFVGAPPSNRVVLLHNVTEVGNKYASFRVIGVEGVLPK